MSLNCLYKAGRFHKFTDQINQGILLANTVKFCHESALRFMEIDMFSLALVNIKTVLKHSPNCIEYLVLKAECLCLMGQYGEALEVVNRIEDSEPRNSDALYVRCLSLYYQEQRYQALEYARRALKYSPDHVKIKVFLKKANQLQQLKEAGNKAFTDGLWQKAHDLYSEALNVDKRHRAFNAILYYNRGSASYMVSRDENLKSFGLIPVN